MRKISFVMLMIFLVVAFTTTSCLCPPAKSKPVKKHHIVKKGPGKVQVVEKIVRTGDGCDVCSLIKLTPSAPKEAILGQTYMSTVDVQALANAGEVKVMTRIPAHLRYVKSVPPAMVQGNKLTWDMGAINKGNVKKIKIWVVANKEGKHWLCYVPFALPRYCVPTFIGKAALAISKQGPATANLNGDVTYTIVVQNKGTATAKGVVVTDNVPQGLQHASGKKALTFSLGDMKPNTSKSMKVRLKAVARGNHCNVAVASSSNAGQVTDKACTNVLKKDVVLSLDCPKEAFVGQQGRVGFGVTNTGDSQLTGVTVTVEYPNGVRVLSHDCSAQVTGNRAVWRVGTLKPGAKVGCNATVVGTMEGTHCVKVTLTTAQGLRKTATCCTIWKGVPKLQITKSAPSKAKLGSSFSYTVVVKNVGTGVARGVYVVDTLPAQVSHPRGKSLRYTVGDLAPNASKTISIPVQAVQTGRPCNVATANASNADAVKAEACTLIQKQAAELTVVCPEEMFVGKRVKSSIVLANTGGVALNNIVITAMWSGKMSVVSAEGSPRLSGNQAVWSVGTLAAGERRTINMMIISKFAGRQCINVSVNTAEGLTKKASCCTVWKGFPALLLEVIDTEDPLLLGEETTYVIEVTNQGTALDRNVKIEVFFPAETQPTQAAGDTRGTIQGKKVSFLPYPVLNPKQKIKFTIRAKAVTKGDSRLRVEMSSELLKIPVKEEESTQVY